MDLKPQTSVVCWVWASSLSPTNPPVGMLGIPVALHGSESHPMLWWKESFAQSNVKQVHRNIQIHLWTTRGISDEWRRGFCSPSVSLARRRTRTAANFHAHWRCQIRNIFQIWQDLMFRRMPTLGLHKVSHKLTACVNNRDQVLVCFRELLD